MLVKNNSPEIYLLKSGDRKLQLNPWRTVEVDPIFTTDITFQIGVSSGKLIVINENIAQTAQEAQEAAPDVLDEEESVEELEAPEGPKTRAKSTRKK